MKKSIYSNKLSIVASAIIVSSLLLSNISALGSIMGYGSSGDYSNTTNTFSGNVIVSSGSINATLTQAVEISNNGINVIIPNGTVIGTENGSSFDINQIGTSILANLPLNLPSSEQDVGKINFGINGQKLNFSKPVKITIPVSTTKSTVNIKVKHFGINSYQTNSLTDTLSSSCNNGIASPNSNIAPVSSGVATIYTCSASQFIAVVDKTVSSGGGGGIRLFKDNCPDGDFSPSYYDKTCGNKPIESKDGVILVKGELKKVDYKGVEIVVYEGYNLSARSLDLSVRIINMPRLSLKEKTSYVNRVNEFLIAKYNYNHSEDKTGILKNKLSKQTILLIWATEKIKKDIKRFK